MLSNNHVNSIIVHKFDFSDEEVMAYYISFLKTLSFRLNKHTIHFFYNEVSLWPRGLAASTASKKVLPLAEMRILSIPDATTVEWRINPLALTITSGYLRISPSAGNAFVIWKCLKIANNMSIFSFWVDSALDFEKYVYCISNNNKKLGKVSVSSTGSFAMQMFWNVRSKFSWLCTECEVPLKSCKLIQSRKRVVIWKVFLIGDIQICSFMKLDILETFLRRPKSCVFFGWVGKKPVGNFFMWKCIS